MVYQYHGLKAKEAGFTQTEFRLNNSYVYINTSSLNADHPIPDRYIQRLFAINNALYKHSVLHTRSYLALQVL